MLQLDLDRVIELVSKEDGKAQIGPCTIRHCLSAFVDLTSPPRRSVLQVHCFMRILRTLSSTVRDHRDWRNTAATSKRRKR